MIKNIDLNKKSILITGGCGFIGSHVVRLFVNKYPNYNIINLDKLTYAGNIKNLSDIENFPNYVFIKDDICNSNIVNTVFKKYNISGVIHLAAESHVDNSISDPFIFAKTNILGTLNLLHAAKTYWESTLNKFDDKLFYHISTDEVYGSLNMNYPDGIKHTIKLDNDQIIEHILYGSELFTETDKYYPHSPYSASKASSDHFVRAYYDTYGLPTIISNCSNNYGPYQFPEKLIPLFINNIINKKELPVYGNGQNVRDWLYVVDHAYAIDKIFHYGKINETYNIGGFNEVKNIDLIKLLIKITDELLNNDEGTSLNLIKFINDRPGHDLRYAINSNKLRHDLNWIPKTSFENGLRYTINWYLNNKNWLNDIKTGKYIQYNNILK